MWPCRVVDTGPPAVVEVTGPARPAPRVRPVHLRVGLCDAGRLDLVAEKAAELGATSLEVVVTSRARRVPDAGAWQRRADRMARVAEAAARQSGHGAWPAPGALVPFVHVLTETVPEQGIILDPRAAAPLAEVIRARPAVQPLTILVGPDTGFSEDEMAAALRHGLASASLGEGMLRTETAAIAACALAAACGGNGST
jgi:16S rRNA (uracil1498-N3)-methyltransferase